MIYVTHHAGLAEIENFWSLLKRGINVTYVAISPWHLFRYVDEQAFAYYKWKGIDKSRFLEALMSVVGKRLMYEDLVAETDEL